MTNGEFVALLAGFVIGTAFATALAFALCGL
jgi:hypothetical protein